jgi:hypothetical protein
MPDPEKPTPARTLGRVFIEGVVFAGAWWSTMALIGMITDKSKNGGLFGDDDDNDLVPNDSDPDWKGAAYTDDDEDYDGSEGPLYPRKRK